MGFMNKKLVSAWAAGVLGLTIWGCGSHQAPETSSVKVTNGRKILATDFPSVVLLVSLTPEGESLCTGTFVNDSQIVTAGHCVEGLDPVNPAMFYVNEVNGEVVPVARALNYKRDPRYDIRLGVSAIDVSIINFPAGVAPAVSQIANVPPKIGDPLTIVGYGNNENFVTVSGQGGSGAGTKRVGTNEVADVSAGFISFIGVPRGGLSQLPEGELVSSGSGDSGGPLFVDGKLAGVTSGGGLRMTRSGSLLSESKYVDLNSAAMKNLLAQHLKNPVQRVR